METNHLDKLNSAQRDAVLHTKGPLLIIAGAGAGKTRTLVYRILHLIKEGISADKILAITFTNKAAAEMRERINDLLNVDAQHRPFVSTFHALGVYILRHHYNAVNLSKYFTILDRDESITKIREACRAAGIDEKRFEPRKILGAISREKGNGLNASEYNEGASEFFPKIVASVWQHYETILAREKAVDFDDLLLKTVRLLRARPDILSDYQERWQYIHVDEYQDTNTIQYQLTTLLAAKYRHLCVVGDIDQSIYGWRGADYTNILNFEQDYPEAKAVLLEENYRSTKNILQAANTIIKKNKQRREKNLFTHNPTGEKITLFAGIDENNEAQFIAEKSGQLIKGGVKPDDIAVLYRANFQSRVLEEAFLREGVSYQVLGVRFYERKEIKDILAFIKLALNPDDNESLKRVINVPPRGIGKVTLAKILGGQADTLPPAMRQKLDALKTLLARVKEAAATRKPSETIKFILVEAGIEKMLRSDGEEGLERLENIREFVTLATKFDGLPPEDGLLELVTEATLVSDQDSLAEGKRGVKLMTVHASKGLEFRYVFVSGLEQDLFPHAGLSTDEERDPEEERRLFYVAVTRAEKKLFLTYAQIRTIFGSRQVTLPSEFIFDIEPELFETHETSSVTSYIDF